MLVSEKHPVVIPKSVSIRITERREFNPWKHFSNSNRYSIMDNVAKNIFLNTRQDEHCLPPLKISKVTLTPPIMNDEIIERFITKDSSFLTPLSFCHVAASLTDKQPEGEDGFLRTDGKKIIIGFIDSGNTITTFWCSILQKWIFDWHQSGEFNHEVDLIIVHSSMIDLHLSEN